MLGLLSILSLSLSLIWCGQWVLCHEKGTPRAININTLSNTPVYILPFLSLYLSFLCICHHRMMTVSLYGKFLFSKHLCLISDLTISVFPVWFLFLLHLQHFPLISQWKNFAPTQSPQNHQNYWGQQNVNAAIKTRILTLNVCSFRTIRLKTRFTFCIISGSMSAFVAEFLENFPVKAFCRFKIWYLDPWLEEIALSDVNNMKPQSFCLIFRYVLCPLSSVTAMNPRLVFAAEVWKRPMIVTGLHPFQLWLCSGSLLLAVGCLHNARWRKVEQTNVTFNPTCLVLAAHIKHRAIHIRAVLVFRVYVTQWIQAIVHNTCLQSIVIN